MQIIAIDAAQAFDNKNLAGAKLPGYDVPADDPRLPELKPTYVMRPEAIRVLSFFWTREIKRESHQSRMGLMLFGKKGAGKTTVIEQFFTRLRVPVFVSTANRATEVQDLLETRVLVGGDTVQSEGPLLSAMRQGCPFVLNEIDKMDPEVLAGLNDIVERGIVTTSIGTEKAERGFCFLATANTNGTGDFAGAYAGSKIMDQALMSRFIKMEAGFPTPEEEIEILTRSFPDALLKATIESMIKTANDVRKNDSLSTTISTRELLNWAELLIAFKDLPKRDPSINAAFYTLDLAVGFGCDPETREAIRQAAQRYFAGASAAGASTV